MQGQAQLEGHDDASARKGQENGRGIVSKCGQFLHEQFAGFFTVLEHVDLPLSRDRPPLPESAGDAHADQKEGRKNHEQDQPPVAMRRPFGMPMHFPGNVQIARMLEHGLLLSLRKP